jgi:hypothetical protein
MNKFKKLYSSGKSEIPKKISQNKFGMNLSKLPKLIDRKMFK